MHESIITDQNQIQRFAYKQQLACLKLEAKGYKHSHRSMTATLKEHYSIKGNRAKLISHIQQLLAELEAPANQP
jgi:hypothetical protein